MHHGWSILLGWKKFLNVGIGIVLALGVSLAAIASPTHSAVPQSLLVDGDDPKIGTGG